MNVKTLCVFAIAAATSGVPAHADVWSKIGHGAESVVNNTVDNAGQMIFHPDEYAKNVVNRVREDPLGAAVNPMQFANVTGLPQPGDLAQMAVEHPEDIGDYIEHPENFLGAPLYATLESARNRALGGNTSSIPDDVRQQLAPYFSADVLDNVVWTSDWGILNGVPQTLALGCGAYAITLVDVIVFRNDGLAHNPVLWAHELTHVQQYGRWGVPEFARKYTAHSGDVEQEAYNHENQIRLALSQLHWGNGAMGGNQQVANAWQPATMCVTNIGACPLMGQQPAGSGCGCSDAWGRSWWGMAR